MWSFQGGEWKMVVSSATTVVYWPRTALDMTLRSTTNSDTTVLRARQGRVLHVGSDVKSNFTLWGPLRFNNIVE